MRVFTILAVQCFPVVLGFLPAISVNPSQKALGLDERYHACQEVVVKLHSLHNSFPEITRLDCIGPTTPDRLTIWCLKISGSPFLPEEVAILLLRGQRPDELLGERS